MGEFTRLLGQVSSGVPDAMDELARLAYPELRKLARSRLYQSGPSSPLGTTTLVHECFLRLLKDEPVRSEDRKRFFAYASKVMRSIIVDMVREAGAQKRGAEWQTTLDASSLEVPAANDELLRIDSALADLAKHQPQLAQIVEMRFFAGLTESEIAEALDSSERTVRRQWEKARLLLADLLAPDDA